MWAWCPAHMVEGEGGEGGLEVVGGQHVVAHGVGEDDDHREDDPQPTLFQGRLHVVGGAAEVGAVGILPLIHLGQRGLDEGGGPAQDGGDPHPKHGAVTAHTDGGGDADDVAGTHPGSGGDHQCAEGGDAPLGLGLFRHHPEGLAQQADLHELAAEGEEKAGTDQQKGDPGHVQDPADGSDNLVNAVKHLVHGNHSLFFKILLAMGTCKTILQETARNCKKNIQNVKNRKPKSRAKTHAPGGKPPGRARARRKWGDVDGERDGNYASVLALAWLNMAALRSSLVVLFRCTAETR